MKSLPLFAFALALLLGACQAPVSGSDKAAEHATQATTPQNLA